MVQEFTPQTQMLNRWSQVPLQQSNDSVGITILHSSQRNSYFTILWRGMLNICNKNVSPNQNR